MNIFDICRAYSDLNDRNTLEVWEEFRMGDISKYKMLDAYLENEGIIGYTQQIITAFRIVYDLE